MDITIALDKLDKVGWDGVTKELQQRGIEETGIATIETIINVSGSNAEKLAQLKAGMSGSETALAGIAELEQTLGYHEAISNKEWTSELAVDISLARGLNYYTGVIVEVTTDAVKMGSIGGGGRYDDLTGLFGLKNMSGVGVSFGIDRIYDVLEELNLFPQELETGSKVLLLNLGGENEAYALSILRQLRNEGVAAEIYPDAAKFDKQMKYANKRNFQYVIIPGDEERAAGQLSLKNFATGEQRRLGINDALSVLLG
ncbi:MAG TPA: ATP phosphoribosyltransferase regulatory subunit, partial [Flavipsychrobacter sp.]